MANKWLIVVMLGSLGIAGCKASDSSATVNDAFPKDPLKFRSFLKERMSDVLAATNCQCCNKPLLQCYNETLERSEGFCPDHCSTCLIEGRVALELKKQGMSTTEIASRTVAVVKGEVPPPAGVDLNNPIPGMPQQNPAHAPHGGHGHGHGHDHGHEGHGH